AKLVRYGDENGQLRTQPGRDRLTAGSPATDSRSDRWPSARGLLVRGSQRCGLAGERAPTRTLAPVLAGATSPSWRANRGLGSGTYRSSTDTPPASSDTPCIVPSLPRPDSRAIGRQRATTRRSLPRRPRW